MATPAAASHRRSLLDRTTRTQAVGAWFAPGGRVLVTQALC